MSDDSTKEIIPGSWRRIIRDEIWENESPKINACWTTVGELQKLERELAEVTKQRDELADACKKLMKVIILLFDAWVSDNELDDAWEAADNALEAVDNALKAMKGGVQ